MPSLSVIVPNYNHARYLSDVLNAILGQTRPPDEVIVIDDASTDNSRVVIAEFARKYPNVRPIYLDANRGVVPNLNMGVEIARGEFVCFAAADDHILPGFFEKSMAVLKANPDADLVCSDPVIFYDNHIDEMERKRLPFDNVTRFIPAAELVQIMQNSPKFAIPGYTVLVRRESVLTAGLFLPDLRWACDWFMLLVIAFRHGLVYLPEGLAAFRVSRDSYHVAGMRDWAQQRTVLLELVRVLNSPAYADVRQSFVDSGVMAVIGPSMIRLAAENEQARALLRPWVARRIRWHQFRGAVSASLPTAVKRIVKSGLGR